MGFAEFILSRAEGLNPSYSRFARPQCSKLWGINPQRLELMTVSAAHGPRSGRISPQPGFRGWKSREALGVSPPQRRQ